MIIHLLQKFASSNFYQYCYVSGSLYMLQFNITFVIFFHSSFYMIFDIFFVGHDVAQGLDLSLTTYQRAHHLFHTSCQWLKRTLCNLLN